MKRPPMWRRIQRMLGPDLAEDAEDELQHHIEQRTRELIDRGMAPEAAREEALRRFGDVERVRREVVEIDRTVARRRGLAAAMGELWQDMRLSARSMRRNRGFAVAAVLTLALGIGANLAVFSALNSVMLRPLPFSDPDGLVMLWEENPERNWHMETVAASNMLDWRERVAAFTDVAAYASFDDRMALTGEGAAPQIVTATEITGNFFSVLGVAPVAGRVFRFEETWDDSERGAVLSYDAWQRSYGGDPDAIGQSMRLDGDDFRVIGVLPPNFRYPGSAADVWLNIGWSREAYADPSFRRAHWLRAVARLAPGATLEQAEAELSAVANQLEAEYPNTNRLMGAGLTPLQEFLVGDVSRMLVVVLAAVGLLLILACANVGNLLLVKSLGRRREMAVRTALGAGRWRLVRQTFAESLLLSAAGAALGLLFALGFTRTLGAMAGETIPGIAAALAFDGRFAAYLGLVTFGSTLVFGTIPALVASRPDFGDMLNEGGRSGGQGRGGRRAAGTLVACEVALALLLVTGAALLTQSFLQLQRVDPGFDPEGVLTATISLPQARYETDEQVVAAYDELRSRAEGLPGVQRVAAVRQLPMTSPSWSSDFSVEGRPPDEYGVEVLHREVTPGYFDALRVPLLRGRAITDADRAGATPVVVINEALADLHFRDADPIGARIAFSRAPDDDATWWTVVGVVGNERQGSPAEPVRTEIFAPVAQDVSRGMNLVIRTAADPSALIAPLRQVVQDFDAELVLDNVRTMADVRNAATAREEFLSLIFGFFAAVAIALSVVGVYGVMAQSIRARQKEIGIRLALGAARLRVVTLLARYSLGVVLAGIAAGLVAVVVSAEVLAALLYDIAPRDPVTLASTALLLLLVGLASAAVPALRAGRTDPAVVLRED
ncbi:MAG: ABC transporter permease [Gemmatimonadota bacterium]